MKYFLIAGEASGDLHGANLIKALKAADPDAEFVFWGGDKMQAQGGKLLKHYQELAFMGFAEVLFNIRTIKKNFKTCENQLKSQQPDVLILIDYPGFNLRIAKFAKEKLNLTIFYYISPKIWAWKQSRAYKIKKYVDKMFVIFPFETDFYKKYDYPVEYVGNPILDELHNQAENNLEFDQFVQKNNLTGKPIVALLPGSRKQEIKNIMPTLSQLTKLFPDYEFVIAGAPSLKTEFYIDYTANIPIVFDQTYDLLRNSQAAIVASGTATLETALLNIPQVVVYTTSPISYHIAKSVIQIKYISLVNIIMDKTVVKELIQHDMTKEKIATELTLLLDDASIERKQMLDNYKTLYKMLGGTGASKRSAELMVELLEKNQIKKNT